MLSYSIFDFSVKVGTSVTTHFISSNYQYGYCKNHDKQSKIDILNHYQIYLHILQKGVTRMQKLDDNKIENINWQIEIMKANLSRRYRAIEVLREFNKQDEEKLFQLTNKK